MTWTTTERERPAAYQGRTWRARGADHAADVAAGRYWSPRAVDSEYRRLREVLLAIPSPDTVPCAEPDRVQHLEWLDFGRAGRQLHALAEAFEALGVRVHLIDGAESCACCAADLAEYNIMFARDLYFMTPQGAVVSRMASEVRAGEERHAARRLAELHVPILATVRGSATLEGADVLWLDRDVALIGTGNRTDAGGRDQAAAILAEQGVRVVDIPLPRAVQHLLGLVQIVDRDLAVIRGELADPATKTALRDLGLDLVEVPEIPETARCQAMNLVTVAPRTVVLPAGVPRTRALLERGGIEVAAEADISELLKAAGGIACATGIVRRDLRTETGAGI